MDSSWSRAAAIALTQIPFLATIAYSLQDWNLLRPASQKFVWFENYVTVFTSTDLYSSMLATVVITGSSVVLSVLFGLILALLLDRNFRGRGLARTLLITPFLVMPAAAALMWKWSLFDANVGIFNWVLGVVGIPAVAWNTDFPALTIIAVMTWQFTPFMMLILLAGLQSQSKDVLEAASVDGAGVFRTFTSMTLPHMRQYIELAALLGTIFMIQVFDPVNIMTKGTGGTKTLPYLLYEKAFIALNVGEAAAYGVVTVVFTIAIATFALRFMFKIFSLEGNK
ncbi:sugar ABC transporter permease [Rhodoglobus aureus]|uniref:Sugar ABC transporter permease n=1 Tax=Rhodoglobus aureus TaxID=191497 RepID=A0ABP4G2P5_9MICO